jgi:hypothetical protein
VNVNRCVIYIYIYIYIYSYASRFAICVSDEAVEVNEVDDDYTSDHDGPSEVADVNVQHNRWQSAPYASNNNSIPAR